jgi:hypothetical protein
MKSIFSILTILFLSNLIFGQTTSIPDANLKQESDKHISLHNITPEKFILPSKNEGGQTTVTFINELKEEVFLNWIHFDGNSISYKKIKPGEQCIQQTYIGHYWLISENKENGKVIAGFRAIKENATAIINENVPKPSEFKHKESIEKPHTISSSNDISDVIDSINLEINNGEYGLIDRFMVIQNEELLADFKYEQDYESIAQKYDTTNHQYNYNHPSWHPYYKQTELHSLQSVTKSITSILLGIAFDSNQDYSVNTKAMPLFKNYDIKLLDKRKMDITIEDLLTMRSGLKWNEDDYTDPLNDCNLMESSNEWIKYVLNQPTDTISGTRFEYNSGASVLLGKIVRIITGKRIDKWAEEKLFEPLGITDYYWKETPDREIDTEGGLYLKAEDLAKIGSLFLNKGKWNDKQIVSESWVTASISPTVKDIGYGYQWWIPEHANGKTKIFAGNGYGGQFLMMSREYNLIIVFNGWNINDKPKKSTWRVLQDRILSVLRLSEEYAIVERLLKEEQRLNRTMTNEEISQLIGNYGDIQINVENNILVQIFEGKEYPMINIGMDIFKIKDYPDYYLHFLRKDGKVIGCEDVQKRGVTLTYLIK